MLRFPNAKINLGLSVTGQRPDGYHNLETLFFPVPLCDILEVIRGETFSFSLSGLPLDGADEDNLVVKAWRMMEERFGLPPVKIFLHKVIPGGAGLGGGSSDAAFMLMMVNELFRLGLSPESLEAEAAVLGADVPFFIRNSSALASGIGNLFQHLELNLGGFYLVLVVPPVSVNTGKAYGAVTPRIPEVSVGEIISQPVEKWRDLLVNDFEGYVFGMFPEVKAVKEELYRLGAVYASMSGSGSAVYGLFRGLPEGIGGKFPGDYLIFSHLL